MPSLSSKPVSPSWVSGPVLLRLILCFGCIAFAFWGVWMCRALVHSPEVAPDAGLKTLIGVASWLVLFGPFAALGGYGLLRTSARLRRAQAEQRSTEPVQIIPPAAFLAMPATQVSPETRASVPPASVAEPLDDATTQRLSQLAVRSARVIGAVVGLLFLLSGITGFVLAWIYTHSPLEMHSSIHYELANFRLISLLLVGCGLSVLVGGFILRETLARPQTTWLVPLHAFAAITERRASLNQRTRKEGNSAE